MRGKDVGTATVTQPCEKRPQRPSDIQTRLLHCLIVSASPERRQSFASAAVDEGWIPIVCADAFNAEAASRRSVLQMAWVDLENGKDGAASGFRILTEHLAERSGMLMVVCGNQGNTEEEIWARELGAWVYLPGVGLGHDVSLICREAMFAALRATAPEFEPPIGNAAGTPRRHDSRDAIE